MLDLFRFSVYSLLV